jgi:hypothetical protein
VSPICFLIDARIRPFPNTTTTDGVFRLDVRSLGAQLGGIRVGLDTRRDGLIFGAAVAYLDGDVQGQRLSADASTAQADAYLVYQFNPFFVGAEGGVSFTDFDDIRRDTGFPTLIGESDTDALSYTLAATLGTNFDLGGIRLTPAFP